MVLIRGGAGSSIHAKTVAQFSVCRQPWNDYINLLSKQDSQPYPTEAHPQPMYRGRKRGMEEWNTKGGVQLHFKRFPDEDLFTNLTRWRYGDMVGDVAIQQFRSA